MFEVCGTVILKDSLSVSMSSVSLSIYLCTSAQPICIHIFSTHAHTQMELNLLTFLWKHPNSTSKRCRGSLQRECTELKSCTNTDTHRLRENRSHVEAKCNGDKQIQQSRIHIWCKYPRVGSNLGFADRGKADLFPCSQERDPQKEETCLLQLWLII